MRSAGWTRRRGALLLLAALLAGAALFQYLAGRARVGEGGLPFVAQAEPRSLPALTFLDANAQATTLAPHRGKVVLLNVWATWCPPCVKEMPSLDRLQGLLGGEGLEVVALSIDLGPEGLPAVKAFYARLGLRHLRVYNDPDGKAGFELGAPGVPVTFLVDRQGREVGRLTGPAEWDHRDAVTLIRRHLAAPATP